MTSIINLISRSKVLEEEIQKLKTIIADAPEGKLIVRNNHSGNYRYYRKIHLPDGAYKELHLGKSRHDIAARMAHKLYAEKKLPELLQEKAWIDKRILQIEQGSAIDEMLKKRPGLSQLLQMITDPENEKAKQWKNAPYHRNQKYPEGLIFPTVVPGLKVRSKAEADIAARLEYYMVPYHYEEIITINGIDYAMDFSCLNTRSKRIMYWDHRGMMDNPEYIRKTLSCDNAYMNAGIIQGINLIVTTETKDHPLDPQWVDELIRFYLI